MADLAASEAAQPGTFGRGWLDLVRCREGRVALEFGRLLLLALLFGLGLLNWLLQLAHGEWVGHYSCTVGLHLVEGAHLKCTILTILTILTFKII